MAHVFLIGIAAGAASALLLTCLLTRSPFALLLVSIAPLPILIASIGWSWIAGLIAAVVAAAAVALIFGFSLFAVFVVVIGFPACWLGYLGLLARPGAAPGETEWYPVGRLVVWSAVLGAAVVMLSILNFTTDADVFRAALRRAGDEFLRAQMRTPADAPLQLPRGVDASDVLDTLVLMVPLTMALLYMMIALLNLWLAGTIVRISGRLRRPWPEIAAMRFPPMVAGALAAALAGSFMSGMLGIVAGLFATTLLMAFAVLGLAIVHKITETLKGRGLILAGIYLAVGFVGYPIFALVLLGLADAVTDVRHRFAAWRGPPAPHT
jgi:hypothetical protein